MKFLLLVRVLTIAALYVVANRFNSELAAPLSIFVSLIHETGHAIAGLASGGDVLGFTLAPDCPCLYACTHGGNPILSLLGGNILSIIAALYFVYLGRILSKITGYIVPVFAFLIFLMFLTTRIVGDDRILSIWLTSIYALIFLFFMLTQTSWAGAFLVFFGYLNLIFIFKDSLTGDVLSDVSRYTKLIPYVPRMAWISLWLGAAGYLGVTLLNDVADTNVDWIEGKRFFKNLDTNKILLFFSILPNLIGFALDQSLENVFIEFRYFFEGIQRFFSIKER